MAETLISGIITIAIIALVGGFISAFIGLSFVGIALKGFLEGFREGWGK